MEPDIQSSEIDDFTRSLREGRDALPSQLQSEKPCFQPGQKGPRCKARDKPASGGVLRKYVGASGSSATKQMGLFQQAGLNLEPEKVEQGLAKLVLSLIELLRQLMERQAIRRMEAGSLSPDEIERLGATLMKLEERMEELKEHFGIDDLNLDLGPLGKLID